MLIFLTYEYGRLGKIEISKLPSFFMLLCKTALPLSQEKSRLQHCQNNVLESLCGLFKKRR